MVIALWQTFCSSDVRPRRLGDIAVTVLGKGTGGLGGVGCPGQLSHLLRSPSVSAFLKPGKRDSQGEKFSRNKETSPKATFAGLSPTEAQQGEMHAAFGF